MNWMEASLEQLSAPLPPWAIRAGAREKIYHDPRNTTAAIVTCGGLCPGLNDVVAVSVTALTANNTLGQLHSSVHTDLRWVVHMQCLAHALACPQSCWATGAS